MSTAHTLCMITADFTTTTDTHTTTHTHVHTYTRTHMEAHSNVPPSACQPEAEVTQRVTLERWACHREHTRPQVALFHPEHTTNENSQHNTHTQNTQLAFINRNCHSESSTTEALTMLQQHQPSYRRSKVHSCPVLQQYFHHRVEASSNCD